MVKSNLERLIQLADEVFDMKNDEPGEHGTPNNEYLMLTGKTPSP